MMFDSIVAEDGSLRLHFAFPLFSKTPSARFLASTRNRPMISAASSLPMLIALAPSRGRRAPAAGQRPGEPRQRAHPFRRSTRQRSREQALSPSSGGTAGRQGIDARRCVCTLSDRGRTDAAQRGWPPRERRRPAWRPPIDASHERSRPAVAAPPPGAVFNVGPTPRCEPSITCPHRAPLRQ
jgi:hypothetical protein